MWTKEYLEEYLNECSKVHNFKYKYTKISQVNSAKDQVTILILCYKIICNIILKVLFLHSQFERVVNFEDSYKSSTGLFGSSSIGALPVSSTTKG